MISFAVTKLISQLSAPQLEVLHQMCFTTRVTTAPDFCFNGAKQSTINALLKAGLIERRRRGHMQFGYVFHLTRAGYELVDALGWLGRWVEFQDLLPATPAPSLGAQAAPAAADPGTQTPAPDASYNGWPNYYTWSAFTWLTDDEPTYRYLRDHLLPAQRNAEGADFHGQMKALHEYVCYDHSPLIGTASLYADVLGRALEEVHWYKVTEAILE